MGLNESKWIKKAEEKPVETDKEYDSSLDTNKDGKVGWLERLAANSKVAAAINKAVDKAEEQQKANADEANASFSSPDTQQPALHRRTALQIRRYSLLFLQP